MKIYDSVIIGAGLTGLTTAFNLKKGGKDIKVLEKSSTYGGVIQTEKKDGYLFEKGPNSGVVGNPDLVQLFDDLELPPLIANQEANKRYILKDDKWRAIPSGPIGGLMTPLFSWYDKFRILLEPFRAPGKDPEETLADMVRRRMGKSYLNYVVDPFILGVYGGDPEFLIPKYALPKLYNLEQNYGSFIGGAIKKMREPKTDLEKRANRKIFSFENGLSQLTDTLYEKTGRESFLFSCDEIVVSKEGDLYNIVFYHQGEAEKIQSKSVITTTGSYALPSILPFIKSEDMRNIDNLHYTKVVEVVLGFNNWAGKDLDGFGGLIPSIEGKDLLGVLFMSACFKDRAPEGAGMLTIFLGGVRNEQICDLSDERIMEIVEHDVKLFMEMDSFSPDLVEITRHDKAIPQYGIESKHRFESVDRVEAEYKGLYIGGNLKSGIGMADRVKQGADLAKRVIEEL